MIDWDAPSCDWMTEEKIEEVRSCGEQRAAAAEFARKKHYYTHAADIERSDAFWDRFVHHVARDFRGIPEWFGRGEVPFGDRVEEFGVRALTLAREAQMRGEI